MDALLDLRPDGPRGKLRAGAAALDVTPATSAGVPLAGYGGEPRRKFTVVNIPAHIAAVLGNCYDPVPGGAASLFEPAQGVHDPIMARALVLDSGDTKAAIVKVDTIGVTRQLRDDVEAQAVKLGIPRQNLIVAGAHTHSGPGAASNNQLFGLIATDCYHAPTYQALLGKIVAALKQADAALQPAAIGIDSTSEQRASKNRMGKPNILDTELGLIKIVGDGGGTIAAVMSFAVHGTCLDADNMLFSADVIGATERELEKLVGGVAIFLNGSEGDVAPAQRGFDGAATIGGYLAESAHKLWPSVATQPSIEIAGSFSDVPMPKATYRGCLPLFGDGKTLCDYLPGLTLPIDQWMQKVLPFAALRLGDVVLATVPGEPTTTVGQQIKAAGKARGFRRTYVVGLANDHMSYVTTPDEYAEIDQYEAQSTLYGPTTGTIVVSSATKAIDAVKPTGWPDAGIAPIDLGPPDASSPADAADAH